MTVVFDSNVWVSALRFGGVPMAALREAYVHQTIAWCNEIEAEVVRVLNVKFGWDAKSAATTMRKYLDAGIQVRIAGSIRYVCRDRDDDMVVACALIAGARMIVSGDNDLLSLGTYSGISLLSPAEYLRQRAAAAKPG